MGATLADKPPAGEGWAWELKWDGIRALAYIADERLRLFTRNGNEVSHRYPELASLAAPLESRNAILDGEIVTFDERGRPSFERLQQRMHVEDAGVIRKLTIQVPAVYVLFDLLWLDGESTMGLPYEERRSLLSELGLQGESWRTPPFEAGDGRTTLDVSHQFGLEGVVAKRCDSLYEAGRRSRSWLKVKHTLRQEFVVGGWYPGEHGRTGSIGSLLIGYWDGTGANRNLHYAGRVGSGLSQADIARLEDLFSRCARDTSPFATGSPPRSSRFVEPILVVEVKFTEWTATGSVRQPTLLGFRTDKSGDEVVRELPT